MNIEKANLYKYMYTSFLKSYITYGLVIGLLLLALIGSLAARKIVRQVEHNASSAVASEVTQTDYIGVNVNDILRIDSKLHCQVNQVATGFRAAQIRTGNSIEGYLNPQSCYAESDFMLTKDDQVVSTHNDDLTGTCGSVAASTYDELKSCHMANGWRIGRLSDFLALPLSEWFIDLKSSDDLDDADVVRAVTATIDEIKRFGRQDGAVIMMYRAPQAAVDLVKQNGIRAGMKGYPSSSQQAKAMVDEAHQHGFELVCMNIAYMNKDFLDYSKSLGVWQLAWEGGEVPHEQWKVLADEGLGGLITVYPVEAARRINGGE